MSTLFLKDAENQILAKRRQHLRQIHDNRLTFSKLVNNLTLFLSNLFSFCHKNAEVQPCFVEAPHKDELPSQYLKRTSRYSRFK